MKVDVKHKVVKPVVESVTITFTLQESKDLLVVIGDKPTGPNDAGWNLYEALKKVVNSSGK